MSEAYLTWIRRVVSLFFEYETPKIVHIRSKRVGVVSRFVQLCIFSYIIGYAIIYQKGYQVVDTVESAVTSKLKGVAFTNFTDDELVNIPKEFKHLYSRVWDVTDYVVPPSENSAFFVTTNVVITPNQTLGTCPEDPEVEGAIECQPGEPFGTSCKPGEALPLGHGTNTGRCSSTGSCEIMAWCPLEKDVLPLGENRAVLAAAENFTVLIKNHIEFPLFGKRRSNILNSTNRTYLTSCLYNNETDPLCPIFRLKTIVEQGGEKFSRLAVAGGVIAIKILWNCDLDYNFLEYCRPVYNFRRLDSAEAKISPGWNFRHASYFGNGKRTLYKSSGILFIIDVQGSAGKFSFQPFLIKLGAGLALLGVSTIICDIIILYLLKEKEIYWEKKYLTVKARDAFNIHTSSENDGLIDNS